MPDLTNPPVPATPLDVEACARLLTHFAAQEEARAEFMDEQARKILRMNTAYSVDRERENATEYRAQAAQLRVLASALPGMGKDREENEHLQEIATTGLAWLEDLRPVLHVGGTYGNAMCDEFTSPTDLHVKALLRFSAYLEETSADG